MSPAYPRPEAADAMPPRTKPDTLLFAGTWLYQAAIGEKAESGGHPPVYVELSLGEESGRLSGRYRARYEVADHAVSTDVALRVQGDLPAGTTAHFTWTSAHGAKGEMEISLFGPRLMNVSWWSTQLGRPPGRTSGTSTLIRQELRR
jgi:hypothetical protein